MLTGFAITIVATALLLVAEYYQQQSLVWVFKPLASFGFLLAALQAPRPQRTFIVGLFLAAIGDVLLIPDNPTTFQAGVLSFLVGHIFYAISFYQRGFNWIFSAVSTIPIAATSAAIYYNLISSVPAEDKVIILSYLVVISLMVASAAGSRSLKILVGAILFYASDILVARNQFVVNEFQNKLWGLPLYYGAQLVLAWSLY